MVVCASPTMGRTQSSVQFDHAGRRCFIDTQPLLSILPIDARRNFCELATPGPSPIAGEALKHIAEFYAIEKDIRCCSPEAPSRSATEKPTARGIYRVVVRATLALAG
ncbi:hypothetical protein [Bradyrhizobium archetypum]|uniref:hypothetical protein n=1 Tax=Bradyrhizobium archetypum TaxID=2721160 RepID=UPI001AED5928|nr:hypothetical protein [Bradyrhizobium archetypum]